MRPDSELMRDRFFAALNTVVLVLGRGPVLKMASLFGVGAFLSSLRMSPHHGGGGRVHVGDEGFLTMDMPAVLLVGGRGPHLFICRNYAPLFNSSFFCTYPLNRFFA